MDEADEGRVHSHEHSFYNPPRPDYQQNINIGRDLGIASTQTTHLVSDYMAPEDYFKLTRSLNLKQREFILDMVKRVKDWDPTQPAFMAFLSGGAGTGKSVLLRAICQTFLRFFQKGKRIPDNATLVLKMAPTGCASYNIRGNVFFNRSKKSNINYNIFVIYTLNSFLYLV